MHTSSFRYAFPIEVYLGEGGTAGAEGMGRSVTMQSISSSLKVREKAFCHW